MNIQERKSNPNVRSSQVRAVLDVLYRPKRWEEYAEYTEYLFPQPQHFIRSILNAMNGDADPGIVWEVVRKIEDPKALGEEIKEWSRSKSHEKVGIAERLERALTETKRKVAEFAGKAGRVVVYYDPEWSEYSVYSFQGGSKDSGYFTDDKDDALNTAKYIAGVTEA